jgi:WD40 repeat protein
VAWAAVEPYLDGVVGVERRRATLRFQELGPRPGPYGWRTWQAPRNVLAETESMIAALETINSDGRTLLVSGGYDGTVRLWDPVNGAQIGDPWTGHTGWVQALTTVVLDGQTRVVSGGADETVRLWDPATGHCEIRDVGAPAIDMIEIDDGLMLATSRGLALVTHDWLRNL